MSYESGALNATLAAAAGDDAGLFAELRGAFIESVAGQIELVRRSRNDADWHMAALRLKGIAAGFQAFPLIALAEEAQESAPGDPVIIARLLAVLESLAAG